MMLFTALTLPAFDPFPLKKMWDMGRDTMRVWLINEQSSGEAEDWGIAQEEEEMWMTFYPLEFPLDYGRFTWLKEHNFYSSVS